MLAARERLTVALDLSSAAKAWSLVETLGERVLHYKVGHELFTSAGPDIVRRLVEEGRRVFLDLKLHEIPYSVAQAVAAAGALGVARVTVHASGGVAMMRAAVEAAEPTGLEILAVTVVTSLRDEDLVAMGVRSSCAEQARRLGALALEAGCQGLVTSPREVASLRAAHGPAPRLITPGVRLPGADAADHARSDTPEAAIRAGATDLIVGRPITQAPSPAATADAYVAAIRAAATA